MECLVCSDSIKHAHLGVNSCRACAVFYKRTSDAKRPLKCKGGVGKCLNLNSKATCRLCRFTRFSEILQRASGTSEKPAPSAELETSDEKVEPIINHESFYEKVPSGIFGCTPVLERLRKGYSLMCVIRNAGELAIRTKDDNDSEIRVLVPASYSTVLDHMKIWRQSIKAFANHTFDDFRELDEESKEFIVDAAKGAMNALDISYRSSHHFPNDDNVSVIVTNDCLNDCRCLGYTTFLRMSDPESFFTNCPDDIDKAKIISESKKRFDMSGKSVRRSFNMVKPTDHEFLAMLGLAFWSNEISTLNEQMLAIAMRNREMIMHDLHAYYAQRGQLEYATRIGHLHCILVNVQNHATLMLQDLQLYRLMNLFREHFEGNCD